MGCRRGDSLCTLAGAAKAALVSISTATANFLTALNQRPRILRDTLPPSFTRSLHSLAGIRWTRHIRKANWGTCMGGQLSSTHGAIDLPVTPWTSRVLRYHERGDPTQPMIHIAFAPFKHARWFHILYLPASSRNRL